MRLQNAEKAGTGDCGPDLQITNRLAGAIGNQADSKTHPLVQDLRRRRVRLRRNLARMDAICNWRSDIERRIADAKELFERGCLYPDQLEDLQDAVAAWRLYVARTIIDLDDTDLDLRRRAA